jgi:ribose transport system substrate-binding protein
MNASFAGQRRPGRCLVAILGLTGALALSGCGNSATPGRNTSGKASSDAAKAAHARLDKFSQPVSGTPDLGDPVDTSRLAGKTVFYVPIALKAGHFPFVQENLKNALAKVGAKLHTCDGQGNPSGFGACLDQAVQQKPAAVVTDYIPYQLASTAYEKLRSAHIPVYIAGAQQPPGVATSATFAFGDPKNYGFDAVEGEADAVIADSDGKAHVLFLMLDASTAIEAQGQHAVDHFKTACPDCVVTVKKVNLSSVNNLPSLVSSALTGDPGIDYVVPQTDTYLAAAVSGIQSAGKTQSVKISSSGDVLASVQQVKSNPQLIAMAGTNPPYVAWTMADAVFRMVAGEKPPREYPVLNRLFTSQNVGSLDLTTTAEAGGEWFGSSDYQRTFAKLWGAK